MTNLNRVIADSDAVLASKFLSDRDVHAEELRTVLVICMSAGFPSARDLMENSDRAYRAMTARFWYQFRSFNASDCSASIGLSYDNRLLTISGRRIRQILREFPMNELRMMAMNGAAAKLYFG